MDPSDDDEVEDAGARLPDVPNVWTGGSLVREEVSGVCSGGAGETCARLWLALLGQNAVGFTARFLVLCRRSNALRSGVIFCAAEIQGCPSGCGQP